MYFLNKTQNEYFELLFPVTSNAEYISGLNTEDEIIETPQRPDCYHDWIDGAWVLDVDRKRDADIIVVRGTRDFKLRTEVDPLAGNTLRWADLTDAKRAEWTQYRIDLLNVPQQADFPTVNWPTKPS